MSILFRTVCTALLLHLLLTGCTPPPATTIDAAQAQKHLIPAAEADEYIAAFRKGLELSKSRTDTAGGAGMDLPYYETFNRDAIALLLSQSETASVRIYLGTDREGKVRLVLMPVNAQGRDVRKLMQPWEAGAKRSATGAAIGEDEAQAVEVGQRCPTMCN